jgi:hypothetical protein
MQPFPTTEPSKFFKISIASAPVAGDIVNYNTKEDSY